MGSIFGERRGVNVKAVFAEAMAEAQKAVVSQLERRVEEKLTESIGEMLERVAYARREKVGSWVEIAGQCQGYESRQSRNGGRTQTVESKWGVLRIWQQRLVCE